MNISPKSDGTIPENQRQVLLKIGKWLQRYGEGIYGTRPYQTAIEDNLRFTCKEGIVYAFILRSDGSPVTIRCLNDRRIKAITCIADGQKVTFQQQHDGVHLKTSKKVDDPVVGFRIEMVE